MAVAAALTGPASAACRQALALGLDVSGSVDGREYTLQMDGLAQALSAPEVQRAFLQMPDQPVVLAIYEWSGPTYQRNLLPWTPIRSVADLAQVIDVLRSQGRGDAPSGTALVPALLHGVALLDAAPRCWRRTLDISGDGKHNSGGHPRDVSPRLGRAGITVNGLVIGADAPSFGDIRQAEIAELSAYFRAYVITGPDAFVETALGFEDFERAMRRKLVRELKGLVLSQARHQ